MIHYITTNGIDNAWVGNELRVIQRKGVPITLHAMRSSTQRFFSSDWAAALRRKTRTIYPIGPIAGTASILLAPALFGRRYFAALTNALFGRRESLRARLAGLAHFFVACHWARGLRKQRVSLIHAQWVHSSGTIGMYGSWLLGAPFSFTGHAADLFRDRVALRDKIRRAEFIVCISEFHRRFYLEQGARPEQLHVVYCGIDTDSFSAQPRKAHEGPKRILSAGRLVKKKGFDGLLRACRLLADRGADFECVIAGSGPEAAPLRTLAADLGLADRVAVSGETLYQEDIPAFMASGDVFALHCVWAPDNDVDGLPQMLMEAMACGAPCVSTRLTGIPDLIEDGVSGILVEPGDIEALADAIQRMLNDGALASRLAEGGRQRVLERFQIEPCLEPLAALFRSKLGGEPNATPAPAPMAESPQREAEALSQA